MAHLACPVQLPLENGHLQNLPGLTLPCSSAAVAAMLQWLHPLVSLLAVVILVLLMKHADFISLPFP